MVFRLRKSSVVGLVAGFLVALFLTSSIDLMRTNIRTSLYVKEMDSEYLDAENQHALMPIEMRKIYDITDCRDRTPRRVFEQRGNFWILLNYVRAKRTFHCYESVTYTTHAEYAFLYNLATLVIRWRGPISVAVYAPGDDFSSAVNNIAYLRNCGSPLIRKYVTFHLFFPNDHVPSSQTTPFTNLYEDWYNCTGRSPYTENTENAYRLKHNLTYPINLARNIARRTALTHFLLSSDIEIYPSMNLIQNFLKMVTHKAELLRNAKPKVFALPVFEIPKEESIPDNKTELLKMLETEKAFIFQAKLCPQCQQIPFQREWMSHLRETERSLDLFPAVKRAEKYKYWDAFYIGTHNEPTFDERLVWEGGSDKITQDYIMCLLNYDYIVLKNAFLVHKPSIQTEKLQLSRQYIKKTNQMIMDIIENELHTIYGTREECYL